MPEEGQVNVNLESHNIPLKVCLSPASGPHGCQPEKSPSAKGKRQPTQRGNLRHHEKEDMTLDLHILQNKIQFNAMMLLKCYSSQFLKREQKFVRESNR